MPLPDPGAVHVDQALTSISVAYMQEATAFVADRVFPAVPVDRRSDRYFSYARDYWFRNDARKRAPGTESAGGGFGLATETYSCDVWAFHKDVDDQTRANADAAVDVEADAARFVTQIMLLSREVEWAERYFTTGVWATDATGGSDFTRWDDESASDPLEDVKNGRLAILQATGFRPNTLTVGVEVHEALKKHPLVLERFKYTSSASVTGEMLARLFEVDRYLVAEAVRNTAAEGAAASYGFVAGRNALLSYAPAAPGLMMPSAGYTFVWRGLTGGESPGAAVTRFRMDHLKSDRVEGEFAFDMKAVAADLGYFFATAVS